LSLADDDRHRHWQLASHAANVPLLEWTPRKNCTAKEVKDCSGVMYPDELGK